MRRGSVVIGTDADAPEMMKMRDDRRVRQQAHRAVRLQDHDRRVEQVQHRRQRERREREQVAGDALADLRPRDHAGRSPAAPAHTNQIPPKIATGMPPTVLKRLW